MSEKEWERFSDLLSKIIGMGGTWQEKAAQVKANVSESDLAEFVAWFPVNDA